MTVATLSGLGQTQQSCVLLSCMLDRGRRQPLGSAPSTPPPCPQIPASYTSAGVPYCPDGYAIGDNLALIAGTSTGYPTSMVTTTPSGNVITQQMPTTSYVNCSSVSPWSACAGGAVLGPNGQPGVCGPCGGGIGLGAMFTTPMMLAVIGGGLLLLLALSRGGN